MDQTVTAAQTLNSSTTKSDFLTNFLPKGWRREEVIRKSGLAAGKVDVFYYSNDGKKFKSKYEMQRYLGDKYDLSLFDYKTGKQSTIALRKQKRLRNPIYLTKSVKYDTYLNLPVRQTASIFKQPVTYITNHKNESSKIDSQTNMKYADKLKPVQLFWELRFNGLRAIDKFSCNNELKEDIEFKNLTSYKHLGIKTETLIRSVAASLYLNPNKIITGQDKDFNKNPRVFIDREQPLIQSINVSEEDLKKQENRVKEMRKNLEVALKEYEDTKVKPFSKDENIVNS